MEHYGTNDVPLYNLTNLQMPTALFTGSKDTLADPEDVKRLMKDLQGNDHVVYSKEWGLLPFDLDGRPHWWVDQWLESPAETVQSRHFHGFWGGCIIKFHCRRRAARPGDRLSFWNSFHFAYQPVVGLASAVEKGVISLNLHHLGGGWISPWLLMNIGLSMGDMPVDFEAIERFGQAQFSIVLHVWLIIKSLLL